VAQAKRRTFTANYKQRILSEADQAKGSGGVGAPLRRERAAGARQALSPQKGGPKPKRDPIQEQIQSFKKTMLASPDNCSWERVRGRRFGIEAAIAGAALSGENAGLAFEAEDRAVDVGLLEEHASVVGEVAPALPELGYGGIGWNGLGAGNSGLGQAGSLRPRWMQRRSAWPPFAS